MEIKKTICLILFCALVPLHLQAKQIVLENDLIKATFNEKTGALEQLISKQSGWHIQRRSELALSFRMLVPLPKQHYNPVLGQNQKSVAVEFNPDDNRIIFTWRNLYSEHGGKLNIEFKGIVHLTNEGLDFEAKVVNKSPYVIETIYWPYLGDLAVPPGARTFAQLGIDYGGMKKLQLYPKFDNQPGYFGVDYPTQMLKTPDTPFSLIDGGKEGLYVGYQDTTAEYFLEFMAQLKPGYVAYEFWDSGVNPSTDEISGKPVHLEFAAIHFPFFNPGESGKLRPIVLQPYQGDWHKGADCYKKWRKTWFKAPPKPEWFCKVHSWQQIHLNNPEDDIRYKYKDLVQIGKDCSKFGVKAIQVTGWTVGGQDSGNPSHDTDPRLGTWRDLYDAIAEVQKMGVKIVLFNKYTWADRTLDWYRRELIRYATKDPYGDPHYYGGYQYQTATQLADINTHRFSPLCPLSAEWRKIADKEFMKSIKLGADGMLYDENQHHGGVRYCFDGNHGHHVPAHVFAGDALLAKGFHTISYKIKPGYLYAGEGNYDLEFRYYHLSYFRVDLNHVPVHRYVAPNEEMMIAVSGYNDRNMINLAMMYRYIISYEPRNFKGRLIEFPRTVAYGQKVDALRRRYKDFLWDGEFRDTVGAGITVDGEPYDHYSVFVNRKAGRKAVVVVNFDYEREITVRVDLFGKSSPLVYATPENSGATEFTDSAIVPPNSVVVVMQK